VNSCIWLRAVDDSTTNMVLSIIVIIIIIIIIITHSCNWLRTVEFRKMSDLLYGW